MEVTKDDAQKLVRNEGLKSGRCGFWTMRKLMERFNPRSYMRLLRLLLLLRLRRLLKPFRLLRLSRLLTLTLVVQGEVAEDDVRPELTMQRCAPAYF